MPVVLDAWRLWRDVLPQVHRELETWRQRASAIPDAGLRRQALASIEHKRFHCEGGSTLALLAPAHRRPAVVRWIVAFQTISDYLDNLSDRAPAAPRRCLRRWHQSMMQALVGPEPRPSPPDPWGVGDAGYLADLVRTCLREARRFPGHARALPYLWDLTSLYIDLQVLKHGPRGDRERLLQDWHRRHADRAPGLRWYEFAAAAGSTLGTFALTALAAGDRVDPPTLDRTARAYFPWVCSLHILLDYWIDQEEDRLGGDLNLTAFYPSQRAARGRLQALMRTALRGLATLPDAGRHSAIVHGLPALYLADGKALRPPLADQARLLLRAAGWRTRLLHAACRWRRRRDPVDGRLQPPPAAAGPLTRTPVRLYAEDSPRRQAAEEAGHGTCPSGAEARLPAGVGPQRGEPGR
ncbi:MAG TPA: DUF2600 family protein [Bacillota bacterium]